jgi:uncharacterized membrane protein YfhO
MRYSARTATSANLGDAFKRNATSLTSSILGLVAIGLALVVIGSIVYSDFVFGQKTLLYKDVGDDSLNVYYPNYVLHSDYLRKHGLFSWSFEEGMGRDIFPSIRSLLITPVVWLPKQAIAQALIYQHFFYLLVAGLFFFRFLFEQKLALVACFLGATLLSFSAYMCMGSCWYSHAAELAAFAVLLYCANRAVRRGDWACLVLAVAAMSLVGVFHLYLTAVFLCLFVPVCVFINRVPLNKFLWIILLLAVSAVLGVGLTSFITIPGFFGMVNSPRGIGPTSMVHVLSHFGVFHFASAEELATAISRLFSNDLAGTGMSFAGWRNYLEAPMSYCGLVCLLLLPQVFTGIESRERVAAALFLLFLVVPVVFPWFRFLFWGFQGIYYRTFSLFGVLGMITLGMYALSRYLQRRAFNLSLLLITALLLASLLFLPLNNFQSAISGPVRLEIVVLLAVYTVLFSAGWLVRRQQLFGFLIVGLALFELIHFDRRTIERPTITKTELGQRIGYNDNTIEAVRDITAADSHFFRITKTFGSGLGSVESLNDALVFGYYSTSSYSSFNNLNYTHFLFALGTIREEDMNIYTQWSHGLLGHPLLLAFACEKYVITNDPIGYQMALPYETFGRYGSYYVFRNNMFLPLGLVFKQYLPETDFLSMSPDDRAKALLYAVTLSEPDTSLPVKKIDLSEIKSEIEARSLTDVILNDRSTALHLHNWDETHLDGEVETDAPAILVFQMAFDPGWRAAVDGRPTKPFRVDCGLYGVSLENTGIHSVQLWYVPPFRSVGLCLSFVCLIIFVAARLQWPRLAVI